MLMLLIHLGENKYAIDTEFIIKVVPKVFLKPIMHVPEYVAGLLNFGGKPIPIIDLRYLIDGVPCQQYMHTRILLFKFIEADAQVFHIGFIAEKVTKTIDHKKEDFIDSKVRIAETIFLDGILTDNGNVIQFINSHDLFKAVKGVLFDQINQPT